MRSEMNSRSPVIANVDNYRNQNTLETESCPKPGKFLWWEFQTEIKWLNVFILILLNCLTIYAILTHDYLRNPWLPLYGKFELI